MVDIDICANRPVIFPRRFLDAYAEHSLGSLDDDERRTVEDALALLMTLVREGPAATCCR